MLALLYQLREKIKCNLFALPANRKDVDKSCEWNHQLISSAVVRKFLTFQLFNSFKGTLHQMQLSSVFILGI